MNIIHDKKLTNPKKIIRFTPHIYLHSNIHKFIERIGCKRTNNNYYFDARYSFNNHMFI